MFTLERVTQEGKKQDCFCASQTARDMMSDRMEATRQETDDGGGEAGDCLASRWQKS